MVRVLLAVLILISSSFSALNDNDENVWTILSQVKWKEYFDEDLGFQVSEPIFSEGIKSLNGKEVELKGYVMPVEVDGDYFVLSSLPYSSCFFCGGAGPETVMEVDIKRNKKWINKLVTVKGKLHLNYDDFYSLIYQLEEAKVVSVED